MAKTVTDAINSNPGYIGPAAVTLMDSSGTAIGVTSPAVTQDQVRGLILAGQGFSATTGKQTSGGAVQTGFCLFNNSTAKNILVYSIRVGIAANSVHQLNLVTSDPGISGITVNAYNTRAGSVTTSLATLTAQNTAVSTTGNNIDFVYNSSNTQTEFLANGASILLPSGAANGILVLVNTSTNVWFVSCRWCEW